MTRQLNYGIYRRKIKYSDFREKSTGSHLSRFPLVVNFWHLVGDGHHNKLGSDNKAIRVWGLTSGAEKNASKGIQMLLARFASPRAGNT